MKKLLITGGAGFIGSNLVHYLQSLDCNESGNFEIVVLDALTYAGNRENLADLPFPNKMEFVHGDVRNWELIQTLVAESDAVIHLAAESHVDRSISDPGIFIDTNIRGTFNILDAATKHRKRVVLVSTDEVYGSLETAFAKEDFPLNPSSPYSASKASADLLALSLHHTFGLDVVITRCTNNYGPRQYPEKLLPLTISRILNGRNVPVYGNGLNVRDWIHVLDHCEGIYLALEKGKSGRVYNFGDVDQITNLELVGKILSGLGAPSGLIEFVEDRKGHDFRYAIDASRSRSELGWKSRHTLKSDLGEVLDWYRERQ